MARRWSDCKAEARAVRWCSGPNIVHPSRQGRHLRLGRFHPLLSLDGQAPRAWPRPRLAAVWPDERCQQGQVEAAHTGAGRPVWAEAQWDAAQALGLADHAVHLDLWSEPHLQGPRRWHWVAASRPDLQEFAQGLRAAGWHLIGAEPETWAARRAWSGLQGGEATVHSRAVEDWRWHQPPETSAHATLDSRLQALRQQVSPRTWLMLCAWGAALGAWA